MILFPIVIANIEDSGDREFMEQLYIEHHDMMHRIARKFSHTVYDTDDIISEVCLVLIKKIELLKGLAPNERLGYVNVTTRNTCLKFSKTRHRRHEIPDNGDIIDREESPYPRPDEALLEKLVMQDLAAAMNEISEGDRELLSMKYILEMTDAEIANTLGINNGALRTRLTRARHRLFDKYNLIAEE